ncbi:IclR family transcriptional regulator [Providencia rettgeri]|nr:IclR family transcriptional regulator [Providencia rettgeri]ELQ1458273.1 IclR family transcriptional regulator [Providencia rettgeri]ELR5189292.1 IclR family transcriptional regulator [Providencia rettgeri]EMB0753320.1 IclR family transcriptional regulator [Providencia rettgeri]
MSTEHMPTIRVLEILQVLAAENTGLSLTQLSDKTNILKGTIYPILKTLAEFRYINYDDKSQLYYLGIACSILSRSFFEKSYWLKMIHREMTQIVEECNEVCQMGILDGADVLYIDKVQSAQKVQLISNIGTRLPAIYSALGKAMIFNYTDQQIAQLYPSGFTPLTQYSVQTLPELRQQLNIVSQNGYAVDNKEINEETTCYAVALRQRNKIIAAISVSIPTFRSDKQKVDQVIKTLLNSRERIEQELNTLEDIEFYTEN